MFTFTSDYTQSRSKEFSTMAGMIDYISVMEPNDSYHFLYCGDSYLMPVYKIKDGELNITIDTITYHS